jgi:UPF0755 protein
MKITPVITRLSGLKKFFLLILIFLPLLLYFIINYFTLPDTSEKQKTIIEIPRGSALTRIADILIEKGLIEDRETFIFWATYSGYEKKLKAGQFTVPEGLNEYQMVEYLINAKENTLNITLLEGWNLEQVAEAIAQMLQINSNEILKRCTDSSYIAQFGLSVNSLEGYLLPDTYHFSKGENPDNIIKYLVAQTLSLFQVDSIKKKLGEMNFTMHQILTLASIVEGEAVLDSERKVIASLYHNRLKRNMRLQADPTIQYIIKGPPRRLLIRDLEIESPYNTYLNRGLPPGPISNPGKASILATLFPDDTNYIYMVASGDGSHKFSRTLAEHNRAKEAFDQVRRKVARERKIKGN